MDQPAAPNWETAKGFTAKGPPLYMRQAMGLVVALPVVIGGVMLIVVALAPPGGNPNHKSTLPFLAGGGLLLLIGGLLGGFRFAGGWRQLDELDIDFETRAVRLGQRRMNGPRTRTVNPDDLRSVREINFGSDGGGPIDWFAFDLKNGEKMKFRCPPELLGITRRSLQRVGLLGADSWKGKATPPAAK
jgi:hypothetical protein